MTDLVGDVYASAIEHPDAKWPADRRADHELALQLLAGFNEDHPEQTKYLKRNSPEEKLARAALAREVRREMRGFVGELLALAIDSDLAPRTPTTRRTKHAVFKNPARGGKASVWARDLLIIEHLKRLLRDEGKKTAAYKLTAEHFGCSERSIRDVWDAHQRRCG
jgi:hypothetical protein